MQLTEPFISVIVPAYNRANIICDTLRSLQKQEYEHYEIIVVDDGSTDDTEKVVKAMLDPRTQYIKKQNGERAAARNFGARMAKGSYVNFFDSDDIAMTNHVAEAARMIKNHSQPEWFHLGFNWATPEGVIIKRVDNFRGKTLNSLMPEGNPLSCNGVFVRKDIILDYPFNEDRELSASEDYELWVRLAARFPLYYSNTVTSLVIDHEARSVRSMNADKLIRRLQLLLHYLGRDEQTQKVFGKDFSKIRADSYSYIALHLVNNPACKIKSLNFLKEAWLAYPGIVKNKRFYAILKNCLIKW